MLLEFRNSVPGCYDPAKVAVSGGAFALVAQITDLSETADGDKVRVAVGLRSGRVLYVLDPLQDILDALSYVTRHIATTPGIVDKVDGEREEVYPWRRREKVFELAAKWRAHAQTVQAGEANMRRPVPRYEPTERPRYNPPAPLAADMGVESGRPLTPEQVALLRGTAALLRPPYAAEQGRVFAEHYGNPPVVENVPYGGFNEHELARGEDKPPPRPMTDADRYAMTQDELETLPPEERARLVDEYVKRENIVLTQPPTNQTPPVAEQSTFAELDEAARLLDTPPADINDPRR